MSWPRSAHRLSCSRGARILVTPPAQGEAIAHRIVEARLSVLEGAGHLANLEEPGGARTGCCWII